MKADKGTGTVIVVARDSMQAARVEAGLQALAGWRVEVCMPRQLHAVLSEHPGAIVAMVLSAAAVRRLLRAVRAWPLSPAIVAITDEPATLWTPAFRALGLRAALPLGATADEVVGAVRAVHAGLLALHPLAVAAARIHDAPAAGAPLTAREREIVELMADGASNRIIAARLGISRHTVKFHVAAILAKLGARSRAEAVAVALRRGVLAV